MCQAADKTPLIHSLTVQAWPDCVVCTIVYSTETFSALWPHTLTVISVCILEGVVNLPYTDCAHVGLSL